MSASAWPEKDEAPLDERLLVDAARLRLFGVNYLEGGELSFAGETRAATLLQRAAHAIYIILSKLQL